MQRREVDIRCDLGFRVCEFNFESLVLNRFYAMNECVEKVKLKVVRFREGRFGSVNCGSVLVIKLFGLFNCGSVQVGGFRKCLVV